MNRIDVKQMVQQAVGSEWARFSERHPALARVVDQQLLLEHCISSLRQTPEYVDALRQVETMGLAHDVLQGIVQKLVRRVLQLAIV